MGDWAVTKPGTQPARCVIDTCDLPPTRGDVYCAGHQKLMGDTGTMVTPPIREADDPDLLERERKKAEEQEAKEYAERRKVKEWEVLPNGTRRPKEYYTAEELAALDAEEDVHVQRLTERIRTLPTNRLPQPADGVSLRDRLTELESELHTEQVCHGETGSLADFWEETAKRRTELLEIVDLQLEKIRSAPTKRDAQVMVDALHTLITEEIRGDW